MRFTLDSNVLVYAVDYGTPDKQALAANIMTRAPMRDAVLTAQALGEFINAVRRQRLSPLGKAAEQAQRWSVLFPVVATTADHIVEGAIFAAKHRLQFWDSVIWRAARSMRASIFLSEDMQDGLTIDGMTVINPFDEKNRTQVQTLLADHD